jgi:hypothetical protein
LRRATAGSSPVNSAWIRRGSVLLCLPAFLSTAEWKGADLSPNKACSGRTRWWPTLLSSASHGGQKRRAPPRLCFRHRARIVASSIPGALLMLLLLLAGQGGEGRRGRSTDAGGSGGWRGVSETSAFRHGAGRSPSLGLGMLPWWKLLMFRWQESPLQF